MERNLPASPDLPAFPNLDHLKKQAKDLLRAAREGQASALDRFIETLPAVSGLTLAALAQRDLKLHDAQSVVAREYGFKSWVELSRYVEWQRSDHAERLNSWLKWVYDGNARERRLAVRMLRDEPGFFSSDFLKDDPWLACAIGDETTLHRMLNENSAWINQKGGPKQMPPLVAVTHSQLIQESAFEPGLLACAELLLRHGADVDCSRISPDFPDSPLSALYGAAGRNHNAAMTRLLLDAGVNPNDNESLYHSVEGPDPACTRLLIDAGVRVSGTNAIARVLDYDKLDQLKLLLQQDSLQKGEAGSSSRLTHEIYHAILRGRSMAHIQALVDAGADLHAARGEHLSLFRYAQLHGRTDFIEMLRKAGIDEPLSVEEQFVAACARADEPSARELLRQNPGIFSRLTPKQLQVMPELAATRNLDAVRLMLALGWPREVKAGWGGSALNLAVYRGDAEMADTLLREGADWRALHNYRDNVLGTLAFASREAPEDPTPGDFVGCAQVFIAHGIPVASMEGREFSQEVTAYLDQIRLGASQDRTGRIG